MTGIKKRFGSLLGPEGRVPQFVEGTTTQLRPSEPAKVEITKTGEAEYRVDVQVPRGLDGDPAAIADLDEATAVNVQQDGTATKNAVSASIREESEPIVQNAITPLSHDLDQVSSRGTLPGILSLIAGAEDEVPSSTNPLNSVSADNDRYRIAGQGWKQSRDGTGTLQMQFTETIPCPPFQAVGFWFYLEDASKINDVGIRLYFDNSYSSSNRWWWSAQSHAPRQTLVDGWNFMRVPADWSGGTTEDKSTIYRWEVYAISNEFFQNWTVGHLFLETPSKARLVMIADRGYTRFHNGLYQDLQNRRIPVTFAVDVTLFGTGSPGGASEAMTEADIHKVAKENGNSISFHGYDGRPTAQMTPEELRIDTAKSLKWLQRHGYSGRMWRAAYVQGAATQEAHNAAKTMMVATAGPTSVSSLTPWPPRDRYDIPRYALDNNASLEDITSWFDQMKQSHMTAFIFVHSEGPLQYDYDSTRRDHFLAQVDRGLSEGWLEAHTFETLYYQSGGTFRSFGGAHVAEYTDADGTRITQQIM